MDAIAKWNLVATHSLRCDVGAILQLLKNENGWEYLLHATLFDLETQKQSQLQYLPNVHFMKTHFLSNTNLPIKSRGQQRRGVVDNLKIFC